MEKEALKTMKEYLLFKNSAGGCAMFGCVVIFIAMFAAMVYGLLNLEYMMAVAGGAGALIFGVLLYLSLVRPHIQSAKQVKEWTQSEEIEKIIDDFSNAKANVMADAARLGKTYVFGRGTGAPVKYEDIKSARIVKITNNGMPLETNLSATLYNGKTVVVCKLPGALASMPPVAIHKVIAAIKTHNPDFKPGE